MKRSIVLFGGILFLLTLFFYGSDLMSRKKGGRLYGELKTLYQGAESYQDAGRVVLFEKSGEATEVCTFSTIFSKPDQIKFEIVQARTHDQEVFDPGGETNVVWSDGDRVYQLLDNEVEEVDSVKQALGNALSMSYGASLDIPSLLGLTGDCGINNLKNIKYLGREKEQGETCYYLKAYMLNYSIVHVWVSENSMLIRRTRSSDVDIIYDYVKAKGLL